MLKTNIVIISGDFINFPSDSERGTWVDLNATQTVFLIRDMKLNKNKIEQSLLKKGNRNTDGRINVKKIGNSFIDAENIIKYKQSNLKVS